MRPPTERVAWKPRAPESEPARDGLVDGEEPEGSPDKAVSGAEGGAWQGRVETESWVCKVEDRATAAKQQRGNLADVEKSRVETACPDSSGL